MNTKLHQQAKNLKAKSKSGETDLTILNMDKLIASLDPTLWSMIIHLTKSCHESIRPNKHTLTHSKKLRCFYCVALVTVDWKSSPIWLSNLDRRATLSERWSDLNCSASLSVEGSGLDRSVTLSERERVVWTVVLVWVKKEVVCTIALVWVREGVVWTATAWEWCAGMREGTVANFDADTHCIPLHDFGESQYCLRI